MNMNTKLKKLLNSLKNSKFGRKHYINRSLILINLYVCTISKFIMEFAKKFMTEKAEKFNGKAAMLGMFALVGAYYFTGQIVPGIF